MARFGVYALPGEAGYVVDVQSNMLDHLNTRVVIPLLPVDQAPPRIARMNPILDIDGVAHSLVTEYIAAVPRSALKTIIADVSADWDKITAAIDFLTQGY